MYEKESKILKELREALSCSLAITYKNGREKFNEIEVDDTLTTIINLLNRINSMEGMPKRRRVKEHADLIFNECHDDFLAWLGREVGEEEVKNVIIETLYRVWGNKPIALKTGVFDIAQALQEKFIILRRRNK